LRTSAIEEVIMAHIRPVAQIVRPQSVLEGAGVRLKRSFPRGELDNLDPFLLFDHFGSADPADYLAGFPMHPHRGIETVTYMLAGRVDHRDSLGNAGTIGAGDVQWMTAGSGILHEEMPKPADGRMEGFQLWVSLPARLKMTEPRYQEVAAASVPVVHKGQADVRVIAGRIDGVPGPVTEIAADPIYLDVRVAPGGDFLHAVDPEHTVFAYAFDGEGSVGGLAVPGGHPVRAPSLVRLGDGDTISAQAGASGLRFLLIAGLPLREPIARYGPFAMNTEEEIRRALADLRNGTFVRSRTGAGSSTP
jgi:redox-sensitive bicupin YhaK (pirin superfamily)